MTETPTLPDAAAVTVDPAATAVLVLDISSATSSLPEVRASLEPMRRLIDRARTAGARVIFSLGRAAEQTVAPELQPRADDPIVRSSADKFFNTDLADQLAGMQYALGDLKADDRIKAAK